MQDHEFFDVLLQQFARTTRAEDTYWMSEKYPGEEFHARNGVTYPGTDTWIAWAVAQDESKTLIAEFENEVDADFVTAVHGCFPDLVRRLHAALDEADRLDTDRDDQEQTIGRLTVENMELRQQLEMASAKAADVLWKIERPM